MALLRHVCAMCCRRRRHPADTFGRWWWWHQRFVVVVQRARLPNIIGYDKKEARRAAGSRLPSRSTHYSSDNYVRHTTGSSITLMLCAQPVLHTTKQAILMDDSLIHLSITMHNAHCRLVVALTPPYRFSVFCLISVLLFLFPPHSLLISFFLK